MQVRWFVAAIAIVFASMLIMCLGAERNVVISKDTVLGIEKEVYDLTSSLTLFSSKIFMDSSKALVSSNAESLVALIKRGDLTDTQSSIVIYLTAYALTENEYWQVMEPLLSTQTRSVVLQDVLAPPLPFGPGYANACQLEKFKVILNTLRKHADLDLLTSNCLESICSGEAGRRYKEFLQNPDVANYPPSVKEYLRGGQGKDGPASQVGVKHGGW